MTTSHDDEYGIGAFLLDQQRPRELMNSELILLQEQIASLKAQRRTVEEKRQSVTTRLLDRIAALLPSRQLLTAVGKGAAEISVLDAAPLQEPSETPARGARGLAPAIMHAPFVFRDAHALVPDAAEDSTQATEMLYVLLNAQRKYVRTKASVAAATTPERRGPQQTSASPPALTKSKELRDTAQTRKEHTLEWLTLVLREALLKRELREGLSRWQRFAEKRDELVKRRLDLKKALGAALAEAGIASTPISVWSSTDSQQLGASLHDLQDRRRMLHEEWTKLQSAAQARQRCPAASAHRTTRLLGANKGAVTSTHSAASKAEAKRANPMHSAPEQYLVKQSSSIR